MAPATFETIDLEFKCFICGSPGLKEDAEFRRANENRGYRSVRYVCLHGHSNIATGGLFDSQSYAREMEVTKSRPRAGEFGKEIEYRQREPKLCGKCGVELPLKRAPNMQMHPACRVEVINEQQAVYRNRKTVARVARAASPWDKKAGKK